VPARTFLRRAAAEHEDVKMTELGGEALAEGVSGERWAIKRSGSCIGGGLSCTRFVL
jgi:hypothetical protein